MNYQEESIKLHRSVGGKLEVRSKVSVKNKMDLSLAYSPGVAGPSLAIASDKNEVMNLTWRKNLVAVISDGTAVLGLGDIGAEAALPVMEGKCVLLKEFGGVDAIPIVIGTTDTEEFIKTVINIAPSFSGINLEDISAPRCFEIERRLSKALDIPVFHDDQHGTAIVLLAAIINAAKVVGKDIKSLSIVINGAGASATACAKLLNKYGIKDIVMCDSKGIVSTKRSDLNDEKLALLAFTNRNDISGELKDALKNKDVFVGLSKANLLKSADIETMAKDPIVFALANPNPEIMPDDARKGGAVVVGTGRSDFPNQINNVLGFPGIFRGLLDKKVRKVDDDMKLRAATALAELVENPTADKVIPDPFDERVPKVVADAI